MLDATASILQILMGLVLLFAGFAKLRNPNELRAAVRDFGFGSFASVIGIVLPWCEALLGLALVVDLFRPAAEIATIALFCGFVIITAWSTLRGSAHECRCFGTIGRSRVGWPLVGRNVVMALAVGMTLVFPSNTLRTQVSGEVNAFVMRQAPILILVMATGCLLLQGVTVLALQGRSISAAERRRPAARPARAIPMRTRVPNILSRSLFGGLRSWHDVLSGGHALLLFTDPSCSSCRAMLAAPEMMKSAQDLPVMIVSRGGLQENRSFLAESNFSPREVILQEQSELAIFFGVFTTPSAYYVTAGGRIGSGLLVGGPAILTFLRGFDQNTAQDATRASVSEQIDSVLPAAGQFARSNDNDRS